MYKQVKFKDFEGTVFGGILDTNTGIVICGCCGGTLDSNDTQEFKIIEVYEDWVDISHEISGE